MTPKRFNLTLSVLLGAFAICLCAAVLTAVTLFRRYSTPHDIQFVRPDGTPITTADLAAAPPPDASGLPLLFPAPKFSLINEHDQPFSSEALAGRPYVAAFIFTNCTSFCPMMTGRMTRLQEQIPAETVNLVSFTVDPDRDTPQALAAYAKKFNADTKRWFFLTGPKDKLAEVESGFKVRLPRDEPSTNNGPEHSDRFLLVDAKNNVRGIYDTKDETAMSRLRSDAAALAALSK